jgi:acyl-coenzyme A thioesterase PaaI-like protein
LSDDAARRRALPASFETVRSAFWSPPPGRVLGRGHPIGDFLEAHEWELLERDVDRLRLRAHVPEAVRNPRGQLFGGFTPTYVDLIALLTFRAGHEGPGPRRWLATLNMRVDYFEPIRDAFWVESDVVRRRGANAWIETRFKDADGTLLAFALTTLRETRETLPQGREGAGAEPDED